METSRIPVTSKVTKTQILKRQKIAVAMSTAYFKEWHFAESTAMSQTAKISNIPWFDTLNLCETVQRGILHFDGEI